MLIFPVIIGSTEAHKSLKTCLFFHCHCLQCLWPPDKWSRLCHLYNPVNDMDPDLVQQAEIPQKGREPPPWVYAFAARTPSLRLGALNVSPRQHVIHSPTYSGLNLHHKFIQSVVKCTIDVYKCRHFFN